MRTALEQRKSRGHVLGCPLLPVPNPRPRDTAPTPVDRGSPPQCDDRPESLSFPVWKTLITRGIGHKKKGCEENTCFLNFAPK